MIRIFAVSKQTRRLETPVMQDIPGLLKDRSRMFWVDLEEPTDEETGVLNGLLGFHPLAVEDCIQDSHSPKLDDYGDYIFMTVHGVDFSQLEERFSTHELDVFLGDNFLVTFHKQHHKSVFDTRGRVVKNPDHLLRSPDWLLYSILDAMVDNYSPAMEQFDERVNRVEADVFGHDADRALNEVLTLKREILHLRRIIVPQRDILNRLSHECERFIRKEHFIYFRDVYDHLVRISETADIYRDILTGILDAYLLLTSNRLNTVMKTLTIIATILMPLSVITGVYGMNFEHMPELRAPYGYFTVLGVMATLVVVMLAVFKRKKWF
jgi:magnesium transporter